MAKQMDDEARRKLLQQLRLEVPSGDIVFEEGDTGREMYILVEGTLEIRRGGQVIATVDQKDTYVGETSTLLGVPRTATVAAGTDCVLMRVPQERVLDFFSHSPALALKLARILAERLQGMNDKHQKLLQTIGTSDYSSVTAYERLAATPARRRLLSIYAKNIAGQLALDQVIPELHVSPAEANRILLDFQRAGLLRKIADKLEFLQTADGNLRQQIDIFAAQEQDI